MEVINGSISLNIVCFQNAQACVGTDLGSLWQIPWMHISYLYGIIHEGVILVWIMIFFPKKNIMNEFTNTNFPAEISTKYMLRAGFVWQGFCITPKCLTSFIPIKNMRIRCLQPTHHNGFWGSNGQIMAWHMQPYLDIGTDRCLKTQTVGLHRYCFLGTSYWGKKNAEMTKDLPLRLAEEYLENRTSCRLMRWNKVN